MCDSTYGEFECTLEVCDGVHEDVESNAIWLDGAKPEREFVASIRSTVRKLFPVGQVCVGVSIAVSDITVGTCRKTVSELRFARLHRSAKKDLKVERASYPAWMEESEIEAWRELEGEFHPSWPMNNR